MIIADLSRIKKIFDAIRKEENRYCYILRCKWKNFAELQKRYVPDSFA